MTTKYFIGVVFVLVLTLFLVACDPSQGNFAHLQNQDINKVHDWEGGNFSQGYFPVNDGANSSNTSSESFCVKYPACCGKYSFEQQRNYDLEQRAIVEENISFCYDLPVDDFILSCPNTTDVILYGRLDCLSHFGVN